MRGNSALPRFTRLFIVGFGASLLLALIIAAGYAVSPRWQTAILHTFEQPHFYINYPVGLRYTLGAFVALNLPTSFVVGYLFSAIDKIYVLPPAVEVGIWFLLQVLASALWWWFLDRVAYRWSRRRG